MKTTYIDGRDILTGNGIRIAVQDGLIAQIEPVENSGGDWLSAGLVDLQVNGFRGHDLNCSEMNAETVSALAREMLRTGVTTFAPTVITASQVDILTRLRAIAAACESDPIAAASIGFIHVEGPNISPLDGYRGAHPVEQVRPPSIAEFEQWQAASGNRVGLVTLSPHFPGVCEYIRHLTQRGVLVSLGHTHASTEEIRAAVEAGATLSTHLGNGMASVAKRHPNPIWSQLAEDKLQATFIADSEHLAPEVFRAMLRAKTICRSILVSDLVALAGMPPGKYSAHIGGNVVLNENGRLTMEGLDTLAGATLPLIDCVGRAVAMSGLPLKEILPLATSHPGALVGNRGALQSGMRADVISFAWNEESSRMHLRKVWLQGQLVGPAS